MKNINTEEVRWLAEHAGILNTLQSLALLAIIGLTLAIFVRGQWRASIKR